MQTELPESDSWSRGLIYAVQPDEVPDVQKHQLDEVQQLRDRGGKLYRQHVVHLCQQLVAAEPHKTELSEKGKHGGLGSAKKGHEQVVE